MSEIVRITNIQFDRFKAFPRFSLHLDRTNILVGPNNSGKSTVIGAIRALGSGLRLAKSKSPERIDIESDHLVGYRIPESSLPISLENVHTDYADIKSEVIFTLSNRNKLHLLFPLEGGCLLLPEAQGTFINTAAAFKKHFPLNLSIVPVLGPVEHREQLREKSTVVAGLATHRASRHFRSYWYYFKEGFEDFAALVCSTWPGMEIGPSELIDIITGELAMFCREDRMARELYWVGFGFQIWCQLLTHICKAKDSSLIVIDEPEVYLHPDVQRQLLGILRDIGPDVILATHSTEIMSEADPSEIVLVDKRNKSGERLKDVFGVQRALDAVGSIQNITLTSLARNRRILFVEGDDDFRLLRRFAKRLGLTELSAGLGITHLESGGFGSWQRVTTLAAGISDALGASLTIAAIYDRDFFCPEEIAQVREALAMHLTLAHVHERKEIENYLLIPEALDRAIEKALSDRVTRTGLVVNRVPKAFDLLKELTEPIKDEIQSQIIARRTLFLRQSGKDPADITLETLAWFSHRWEDFRLRITLLPGKVILRQIRERLQNTLGISLTDAKIIESMHRNEIPADLVQLLHDLDQLRKSSE